RSRKAVVLAPEEGKLPCLLLLFSAGPLRALFHLRRHVAFEQPGPDRRADCLEALDPGHLGQVAPDAIGAVTSRAEQRRLEAAPLAVEQVEPAAANPLQHRLDQVGWGKAQTAAQVFPH